MKVGTDAIILGALAETGSGGRLLDVGTGTGVIALMLAQRTEASSARIDAIEIDPIATREALDNVRASAWSDRITVTHDELGVYCHRLCGANQPGEHSAGYGDPVRYDAVVCNPPYFDGTVPNRNNRAFARHARSLTPTTFFASAGSVLDDHGTISTICPTSLYPKWKSAARLLQLAPRREWHIHSTPERKAYRVVSHWKRIYASKSIQLESRVDLVVEYRHHHYTEAFRKLTEPFYLELTFRDQSCLIENAGQRAPSNSDCR